MNPIETIHQRWAADDTLDGLLPAARLITGTSADAVVPYATVTKKSARPVARHNDGSTVEHVGLRIEVFHEDHDAAATITDRIKAVFDRAAFDLTGGDKVIDMQRSNDYERQDDDGTWCMVIDYTCTVYVA